MDRIAIYDVDSTRAATLAAAVAASTGISASVAFNQDVRAYDLIVNCAPTGGKLEIDLAPARPETLVVDIVLKPAITPLLAAAQSHGLKVHEGIHMLSGQVTALLAFFSLDSLLARVQQTLVAYEEGRAATGEVVTADDVVHARFNQTKFREGYDQNQVDDFLDKVAVTLRAHEAR